MKMQLRMSQSKKQCPPMMPPPPLAPIMTISNRWRERPYYSVLEPLVSQRILLAETKMHLRM
jgi:hypothetical protein